MVILEKLYKAVKYSNKELFVLDLSEWKVGEGSSLYKNKVMVKVYPNKDDQRPVHSWMQKMVSGYPGRRI